jgi:hypothetical protein
MKFNIGDVIEQTDFRKGYVSEILKELVVITWFDETGGFIYTEDEIDTWITNGDTNHYPVVK